MLPDKGHQGHLHVIKVMVSEPPSLSNQYDLYETFNNVATKRHAHQTPVGNWLALFCRFDMAETTPEGLRSSVTCSVCKLQHISETFTVMEGAFEEAVMPEHIEEMWGPIPLPKLPPGVTNTCQVANHR